MTKFVKLLLNWRIFDSNEVQQAIDYLKQELVLSDQVGDSGSTQREHLEAVERQTGIVPAELQNLIELPDSLREVWSWYKRLSNRRQSGMGINPIAFTEIKAFFDMQLISPNAEELQILEYFDNLSVSHFNKKQAEASKKAQAKSKR